MQSTGCVLQKSYSETFNRTLFLVLWYRDHSYCHYSVKYTRGGGLEKNDKEWHFASEILYEWWFLGNLGEIFQNRFFTKAPVNNCFFLVSNFLELFPFKTDSSRAKEAKALFWVPFSILICPRWFPVIASSYLKLKEIHLVFIVTNVELFIAEYCLPI